MRRRWILATGLTVVLLGGAAFGVSLVPTLAGQSTVAPAPRAAATATAKVSRGKLVDTRTMTGTLGFGDPVTLRPSAASEPQRITWIAPVDSVVERGEPLYAIDGEPVVLLYGSLPHYRTLRYDGAEFKTAAWVELETLRADAAEAELTLELERERRAHAEATLADASARLADGLRSEPQTAEFGQLARAVHAAEKQLKRIGDLLAAKVAPPVQLEGAETDLAMARANLDRAIDSARKQVSSSTLDLAAARVAIVRAERKLADLHAKLRSLESRSAHDADLRQLAENLAALGYTGTAAEMVRAWQAETGQPETGIVAPRQVVVGPGPLRIARHEANVGDVISPSAQERSAILTYTSTERLVTVALNVADQHLAAVGRSVTVTLPDGTEVAGAIAEVGSVVTDGKIDISVTIADQDALGALNAAAVDVDFVSEERQNVLSVPVAALLALPDRATGVEVVEAETTRVVPVRVGMFASGRVEVSGEGIAEGALVGVPR